MPDYDTSAIPAAPVARVLVWAREGEVVAVAPMLLDSGSDVTIVSLATAQAVGANLRPYQVPLQSYAGDRVNRDRARLAVRLLHYTFRGNYLVDDVEVGVLGRNVLNSLVVTLDGPRLIWSAQAT